MIMGSQIVDNVSGGDPTNPAAPVGQDSSVFSNVVTSLGTEAAQVYRTINAPPSPSFQQVSSNQQTTLLIVGAILILAIVFWPR